MLVIDTDETLWGFWNGAFYSCTGTVLHVLYAIISCSMSGLNSCYVECLRTVGNPVYFHSQGWSGNHDDKKGSECLLAQWSVEWRNRKVTWKEGQGKATEESSGAATVTNSVKLSGEKKKWRAVPCPLHWRKISIFFTQWDYRGHDKESKSRG